MSLDLYKKYEAKQVFTKAEIIYDYYGRNPTQANLYNIDAKIKRTKKHKLIRR